MTPQKYGAMLLGYVFMIGLCLPSAAVAEDPVIQSMSATSVPAGSEEFTLTIIGRHFQPDQRVSWGTGNGIHNSRPLRETFISSNEFHVQIPEEFIANPGYFQIYVREVVGIGTNWYARQDFTVNTADNQPPPVVQLPTPPNSPPVFTANRPCCVISVIQSDGLVSAKESGTKRAFQFKVDDGALLATLRIGQKIFADFDAEQVAIEPARPCCPIVQASAEPAVKASSPAKTSPAAPTKPVQPAVTQTQKPVVHGSQPCCAIVANPAMKGRMGKLIFAFPAGSNVSETYIAVFKPGQEKDIMHWYGAKTVDLIPGAYAVTINGKRVENVPVQSGHDTRVRVGVLRVNAGSETYVQVMGADKQEALHFYGKRDVGMPAGALDVIIAGQSDTVAITDGAITDF